jgi:hypothetical protein
VEVQGGGDGWDFVSVRETRETRERDSFGTSEIASHPRLKCYKSYDFRHFIYGVIYVLPYLVAPWMEMHHFLINIGDFMWLPTLFVI